MNITIFTYIDYHHYLSEWYKAEKLRSGFTLQEFSQKAGFNSHSYAQRVFSGAKNLSRKSISIFSEAMEHSENEAEYFMLLVHFKHAKNDGERFRCLRHIQERSDTVTFKLDRIRFEYFHTWYHPVIRELVTNVEFEEDYQKLGRLTIPPISSKEAHDSVRLLTELGLIKKSKKRYLQLQQSIIAQDDVEIMALRLYQKECIRLGSEAIDRFTPQERNVMTFTLGLSKENSSKLNELVNEFHTKIMNLSNLEQTVEETRQINVQLFPLSKPL